MGQTNTKPSNNENKQNHTEDKTKGNEEKLSASQIKAKNRALINAVNHEFYEGVRREMARNPIPRITAIFSTSFADQCYKEIRIEYLALLAKYPKYSNLILDYLKNPSSCVVVFFDSCTQLENKIKAQIKSEEIRHSSAWAQASLGIAVARTDSNPSNPSLLTLSFFSRKSSEMMKMIMEFMEEKEIIPDVKSTLK